jgi:tRNA (Thr-GGU) A37 N-methylase
MSVKKTGLTLRPIGVIRSIVKTRSQAPKQGLEGAPDAWLEMSPFAVRAAVHPRSDPRRPLAGVFATRSPDRPNPLGLHRVTVRRVAKNRLRIGPVEAIDGTPVVDIEPVLSALQDF